MGTTKHKRKPSARFTISLRRGLRPSGSSNNVSLHPLGKALFDRYKEDALCDLFGVSFLSLTFMFEKPRQCLTVQDCEIVAALLCLHPAEVIFNLLMSREKGTQKKKFYEMIDKKGKDIEWFSDKMLDVLKSRPAEVDQPYHVQKHLSHLESYYHRGGPSYEAKGKRRGYKNESGQIVGRHKSRFME